MVRKQLYITPDQEVLLKQRARERSLTEAELLRQGLDLALNEVERERLDAWESVKQFLEERRNIEAPQARRSWTREELHDERPKYLSR